MNNFGRFHDGSLDGILIDQASVWVFLRTAERHPFVIRAGGVVALVADGFRAGNIILDVLSRQNGELTLHDIAEVYGLPAGAGRDDQAQKLLTKAREQKLIILEINPSYGASCLVLSQSVELLPRNEWAERYSASAVS